MEHVEVQGARVPALGLGTWKLRGDPCRRAVAEGLDLGYRHVDTAQMYRNEAEVGAGVRDSGVDPSTLWVTTKVDNHHHAADDVRSSVEQSARALEPATIDLLLVHWPVEWERIGETLDAMQALQEREVVSHLGVSNFSVRQVERARAQVRVLCNQVEYHPFVDQSALLEQARRDDLLLTAYSPLAKGRVVDDPVLTRIGERHGRSPVQVTLRWLLDQPNVSAIPKASSRDHLAANLDLDFALADDERAEIDALAR